MRISEHSCRYCVAIISGLVSAIVSLCMDSCPLLCRYFWIRVRYCVAISGFVSTIMLLFLDQCRPQPQQ